MITREEREAEPRTTPRMPSKTAIAHNGSSAGAKTATAAISMATTAGQTATSGNPYLVNGIRIGGV